MKILVTGASGFIGSHFLKYALSQTGHDLIGFYRDTSQMNKRRLPQTALSGFRCSGLRLVNGDLLGDISGLAEGCDAVVNFAAKTFVDHSIRDPWPFVEANIVGTYRLLEEARKNRVSRFIQVSTDEVYGSILSGAYFEDARINPTNPYSASKAGADALVLSYAHTFGMWTAVTRTENNYGPYQHPQKVIPAFIRCLLKQKKLPIYGDGKHRRQWLWVDDHCSAIMRLLFAEVPSGQVFHIAGGQELENLELAKRIIREFDIHLGQDEQGEDPDSWWKRRVEFISDSQIRPGHDRRYALMCEKMKTLGWKPEVGLDVGIKKAVQWYMNNAWWLL